MFVEQYILFMMQDKMEAEGKLENRCMGEKESLIREIGELKEKRKLLLTKREMLEQQNFEAYQKYASGSTEGFQSCESEIKLVEEELNGLDNNLQMMETAYSGMECGGGTEYSGSRSAELSEEMINSYIDKIIVYDEQHIEIRWKDNAGQG